MLENVKILLRKVRCNFTYNKKYMDENVMVIIICVCFGQSIICYLKFSNDEWRNSK